MSKFKEKELKIEYWSILLIEAFASVEQQLKLAKEMGFSHADITDTNAGGSMLGTAGFSPTVSLDDNPFEVKRLFEKYGITPSTVCGYYRFWEKIGACLAGGEVVCLIGQLGSGKTHLIKGIAKGLGFCDCL